MIHRDSLWSGLAPCPTCGAPCYDRQAGWNRARGHFWNPDVPLVPYEALPMWEAIHNAENTGDWWGQLQYRCEAVIMRYGSEWEKNSLLQLREKYECIYPAVGSDDWDSWYK